MRHIFLTITIASVLLILINNWCHVFTTVMLTVLGGILWTFIGIFIITYTIWVIVTTGRLMLRITKCFFGILGVIDVDIKVLKKEINMYVETLGSHLLVTTPPPKYNGISYAEFFGSNITRNV